MPSNQFFTDHGLPLKSGDYANKGTYMYVVGKYAGTLWFGKGGSVEDSILPLGTTALGAYRPALKCVQSEVEAKALASRLGLKWGGTGDYGNKGAYAYRSLDAEYLTKHAGTAWWGTGGDSTSISLPLDKQPEIKARFVCLKTCST